MTQAFQAALDAAATGGAPDTIALMRLLMEAQSPAAARAGLAAEIARLTTQGDEAGAARLARLRRLWEAHPEAWSTVRAAAGALAHDQGGASPEATLAYLAQGFDRLVAASPEASVALYSLGSPELLAAATDEVVAWMAAQGLLGRDRDALDFGCGIGRFLVALAPRMRSVAGRDISAGMVAEARRRCRDLSNVRIEQGSGRDLAGIPDGSLDLVLAADVFPYLVQAGGALPSRHMAELGRVLRPGGAALILNCSYRGDLAADRTDLAGWAARAGFHLERNGSAEFSTWDAAVFLLRKTAGSNCPSG